MTTFELVLVLASIFITFETAKIVMNLKTIVYYRRLRLIEQSRSEFAETRTAFFHEAINHKEVFNGELARVFYSLLTFLVRNPDNFGVIAQKYLASLDSPNKRDTSSLVREFILWPDSCKKCFAEVITSIHKLPEVCAPEWLQALIYILKKLIRIGIISDSMRKKLIAFFESKEKTQAISDLEAFNGRLLKA